MIHGCAIVLLFTVAVCGVASGQWQMQDSHSTASFRGIHSVDAQGTVAWASGTGGMVLRTEDGGAHWLRCATPDGAERLDFRGVWAWDGNTSIVLSSGPGDQSRLFKTTDACRHWTEELKNSTKEGFWDAVVFRTRDFGTPGDDMAGVLIGDPVAGVFEMKVTKSAHDWSANEKPCKANPDEAAFAASNSSVFVFGFGRYIIGTGGKGGPRALLSPLLAYNDSNKDCVGVAVPIAGGNESSGVFSIAFRDAKHGIAVGGDYKKPTEPTGTAAWTADGGRHWKAASKPPHGYRSAVAWDSQLGLWIAAGPNGSDISKDDGKSWQPLDDGNWNALSLPYAVGPQGRIGKLEAGAIKR
jgi:photosystem II stability/assembly factor-like uncharacterized protein